MKLEPIAIVGIGCRFPGGVNNPESFWRLLRDGIDAITEIPADRWDVAQFYDPDPSKPNKTNTRWGGFLENIDQFDPQFFGIAPREAVTMDPQQRLLLEVTWEALEDGGYIPDRLRGSQTGVFIGIGTHDYSIRLWQHPVNDPYATTGTGNCIAANRISYLFDLKGPSLAIDTACSSSLVAVHLACQSLWCGESSLALAGGVNVLLLPTVTAGFSKGGFMSGTGRCRSFDAAADGYVRSEGAGIVLLKPLSEAVADQDTIYAVIRGSAVNQDGFSQGIAAPNPQAQAAVLREAYRRAGVDPAQVQYIEAHGTGTKLGDPIELEALGAVLTEGRTTDCAIGSVKTNIGHTETAAGIAGLIKVALALKHQQIPPSLHFHNPNPQIPFEQLRFQVQTTLEDWPSQPNQPQIAGVNSFGFGGTNAHVVIEAAPKSKIQNPKSKIQKSLTTDRSHHLLTLSAKTTAALRALAQRYANGVANLPLADLCFTANVKRSQFSHRLTVVAETASQLQEQLENFAQGKDAIGLRTAQVTGDSPEIAFLFTGQGSQYLDMGKDLYGSSPVFKAAIDACDRILKPELGRSILTVIWPNPKRTRSGRSKTKHPEAPEPTALLDQTCYTQPALFAIEYALAQLWISWGVRPSAVMGHSIGEYVAACIAGVFSLEDALKLVVARGQLMQELSPVGTMAAVMADEQIVRTAIQTAIQDYEQVAVAAINGPENIVISGGKAVIAEISVALELQDIKITPLNVSHAFHSPLMEPMVAAFKKVAERITYHLPKLPLVSNVTGGLISEEIATPDYWCRHVRQTVRFADGLAVLHHQGYRVFLEVGAKPILCGMGRSGWPQSDTLWLPSLRSGQSDWQSLLQSLAQLYSCGIAVDWEGFDRPYGRQTVTLPTYPFQRQRFWWEPDQSNELANERKESGEQASIHHEQGHPLLDRRLVLAGESDIYFETRLEKKRLGYLDDHRILNQSIFPAAAYIEMILAAAKQLGLESFAIADITIEQPLRLNPLDRKTLQLKVSPDGSSYRIEIYSLQDHLQDCIDARLNSIRHVSGKLVGRGSNQAATKFDLSQLKSTLIADSQPIATYYHQLQVQGLDYGSCFQGIQQIWRGPNQALGEMRLPQACGSQVNEYKLHPILLDACFQLLGAVIEQDNQQTFLPIGIDSLQFYHQTDTVLWGFVEVDLDVDPKQNSTQLLKANVGLIDQAGNVLAEIRGLTLQSVRLQSLKRLFGSLDNFERHFYEIDWQLKPKQQLDESKPQKTEHWLIFADYTGIATQITDFLRKQGQNYTLVVADQQYEVSEGTYQINPAQIEDVQRLFTEIHPPQQVIYLWGLDQTIEGNGKFSLSQTCESILYLLQVWSDQQWTARLWLVTQGAQVIAASSVQIQQAPIWGLGRVIRLEHPELHCTCVDLDPVQPNLALWVDDLLRPDQEDQIGYRRNHRYVARLVRSGDRSDQPKLTDPDGKAVQLKITDYGVLDNLTLAPLQRRSPATGEVEIQVRAAGVNFRDVLNALGMLQPYLEQMGFAEAAEIPFGWECAGTIAAVGAGVDNFQVGDAVIAVAAIGSLATFVTVPAIFVVAKPRSLSFAEAATIPTTFLTAYYGLHHLAKLQAGERVLIHAAAGGVGQAAVQLAQQVGAEVFATASPSKWDFLQSIGVAQVMNSRTGEFAEEIQVRTQGQGVDVVLNSLNGEVIARTLTGLADQGRFVEIGKVGIWTADQMRQVRSDVAYLPFDLLEIAQQTPELMASMLQALIPQFEQGRLRPLPYTSFKIEAAVDAFRYMAQAKHIGKVVLTFPSRSTQQPIVRSDGSYLITGGLGGLGLQVAQWLADQGAKHLLLLGRSAASATATAILQKLERQGVTVDVIQADISHFTELDQVLSSCCSLPLRGIIHAAGMIDDGLLQQQTGERFEKVMAAKVQGGWNLHRLTQDLPIDFFVCFSSITAVLGSVGQGNYAAANAFLDALIQYRRQSGLPGLSVNWGAWAEVGMAARLGEADRQRIRQSGMQLIDPDQGIQALEALLQRQATQISVLPIDWPTFRSQMGSRSFPLLDSIAPIQPTAAVQPSVAASAVLQLANSEDRLTVLQHHLRTQLAKVLGFNSAEAIDLEENFADLGMDSLMAVEFRNRLESSLGCAIPQTLAFDYPTVETLAEYLLQHHLGIMVGQDLDNNEHNNNEHSNNEHSNNEHNSTNGAENSGLLIREPLVKTDPGQISAIDQDGGYRTSTDIAASEPIDEPMDQVFKPDQSQAAGEFSQSIVIESPALTIPTAYYQFEQMPEYLNLRSDLARVEQLGNPFFELHDGITRDTTQIGERKLISYSSYNYLGMSGDPIVSQAAKDAIDRYGTSVSASRVVAGERPIHRQLEQEIARFMGTEDCIVYIGGHTTNVTTIGHLFGEKDLILYDALSHNSIRQGCALAKATAIEFPHNDWQTLEGLLKAHRPAYQKVLIAIEGIYSTDGDIAPLPEIVALKLRYKTFLLVDEAHSIGVLGRSGRGIGEHFNVPAAQVDLWMGTLSKSFASCGGYIAGSKAVVEYLKYTAPGFVYSVGISPANTAAALAALQVLHQQPQRVTRLQERSRLFLHLAQQQGLNTGSSEQSPVIPIVVGEPQKAVRLAHALFERGISVQPMVYPSVPYHAARLRFFVTCLHTETQVEYTVKTLSESLSQLGEI